MSENETGGHQSDGVEENEFVVWVDDNFHYQDEDKRWCAGRFATYEEALAKAMRIAGDSLGEHLEDGMSASELYSAYCSFGDDPWITPSPDGVERFSAWTYAKKRSEEITSKG